MYVWRNIELLSRNHSCRGKTISTKHYVYLHSCVFSAPNTCIVVCCLSDSPFTFPHHHHRHHHHHLPPWIKSFDLFRHRRVAIVSWGVRDPFLPGVCRWGRVSGVWCCPFFRDGWSSFVCIWVSRLVFPHYLINDAAFGNKQIAHKIWVLMSLIILSKTFFSL